jgi:Phage integrase, N-terminal SAM-like domain
VIPEAVVERAMKVQEVILRAMAKRMTWWQAAEVIGISDRQMRRWHRERAARREHDRIMHEVNRMRGSVAPAVKGRTFRDAVAAWRTAVAPHLSPATVRQRESYLRKHILPRFGDAAPHTLNLSALQQFATDLRKVLSRKTVINCRPLWRPCCGII